MTALLVALDLPNPDLAVEMARALAPSVDGFKVGLQLLLSEDPFAVEKIVELGHPVFVDAKLHDIPATAHRAARQLGKRGARWVTAHASGGVDMMRAATEGLGEGSEGTAGVLGVTVLTSLGPRDLASTGVGADLAQQVSRLAAIASESGAEGIICAVHELGLLRQSLPSLVTFTPGIRTEGASHDDQRRVATVESAVEAGADYIVVGRSITASEDPAAAAATISAVCSTLR